MRPRRILVALAAVAALAVTQLGGISPASARTVGGVIDTADPTMASVFITTPECSSQGFTALNYEVRTFTVRKTFDATFSTTYVGDPTATYLFEGSFTPAAAFPTCVGASNSSGGNSFTQTVHPGTTYYLVVVNDSFDQTTTSYTTTVDDRLRFDGDPVGPTLTLDPSATTEPPTTEAPVTEPPSTDVPSTDTTGVPPTTQTPSNPPVTPPPAARPATGAKPMNGKPTYTG